MGHNGSRRAGHPPRKRGRAAPDRLDLTRRLCREAAAQTTPLALEQWSSWLLGEIWRRRCSIPGADSADPVLRAGTPVLDAFAELGTASSKLALAALGQLDRGLLGRRARRLAATLDGSTPGWLEEIGVARI